METLTSDRFRAEVERLAYQFWEARGRPSGSDQEDWFRAERELRHHFGLPIPGGPRREWALPSSALAMEPVEY